MSHLMRQMENQFYSQPQSTSPNSPLTIPSTLQSLELEKRLRQGAFIAVYMGENKYMIFRVKQFSQWTLPVIIQIPANSNSLTIGASQPSIGINNQPNPLYWAYNTQSTLPIFYLIGLAWNSPYVSLEATDPAGTPYWQLSSSVITRAYVYPGNIDDTVTTFVLMYNKSPTITFHRRTNMMVPYPPQLPLNFSLIIKGYTIKYYKNEVITATSIDALSGVDIIAYLMSPQTELLSGGEEL